MFLGADGPELLRVLGDIVSRRLQNLGQRGTFLGFDAGRRQSNHGESEGNPPNHTHLHESHYWILLRSTGVRRNFE